MSKKIEIKVAEAEWLYGNVKPLKIYIFELNYDFWYDMDEGYHDENEIENLNENGKQYVVLNNCPIFKERIELPFYISLSLEEAKNYVDETIKQKLHWHI